MFSQPCGLLWADLLSSTRRFVFLAGKVRILMLPLLPLLIRLFFVSSGAPCWTPWLSSLIRKWLASQLLFLGQICQGQAFRPLRQRELKVIDPIENSAPQQEKLPSHGHAALLPGVFRGCAVGQSPAWDARQTAFDLTPY